MVLSSTSADATVKFNTKAEEHWEHSFGGRLMATMLSLRIVLALRLTGKLKACW